MYCKRCLSLWVESGCEGSNKLQTVKTTLLLRADVSQNACHWLANEESLKLEQISLCADYTNMF